MVVARALRLIVRTEAQPKPMWMRSKLHKHLCGMNGNIYSFGKLTKNWALQDQWIAIVVGYFFSMNVAS